MMHGQAPGAGRADSRADGEANRYTRESILRSEEIYGRDFQSPGGRGAVESVCRGLRMRPGMTILDIGSGLGGAAFYFAEEHGATVVGLDASADMIALCAERTAARGLEGVSFLLGDVRAAALGRERFDLAWSRDSMLYVEDKATAWRNVHAAVKRGGQLLVTDFCGGGAPSDAFAAHVARCGYHLQDLERYARALRDAGFELTRIEDMTASLIVLLRKERDDLARKREDFIRRFCERDYEHLQDRWSSKIRFCEGGDLRWGLFVGDKP